MSNHRVARVVDTRLEANSENSVTYVVEEGPAVASYVPLTASSYSNQGIVWNLNNIADRTCRDSRMVISATAQITLNVTNTSAGALTAVNSDNFGLKCYPFNRLVGSCQHQINQASYTMQVSQMIDSISRLNSFPVDANFYENTQPDIMDSYLTGSNLNPLGAYTTNLNGDGVFKPRSLNWTVTGNSVAAGITQNVVITVQLYEPLASPFNNISSKNRRGLYAITGEIITLQFVNDLTKMFAYITPPLVGGLGIVLNSSAVSLVTVAPKLMLIYLTPHENLMKEIPHESVYQYNDYQVNTNDIGACVAGATLSATSQVVNFTNIPSKVLVYARLSDANVNITTPDKYLTIDSISVTFDNGQPQLNNAITRQLWDISKRNGLQMPASAFQQLCLNRANSGPGSTPAFGCGSVLVLDPVLDLGIRPGNSSSSAGRYIFQATINFKNNTLTNFVNCTLYVIGVNSAVLERVGSQYRNMLLTLPQNVLDVAHNLPAIDHQMYVDSKHSNAFFSGGGVGDWFKKAFSGIKKGVQWGMENPDKVKKGFELAKDAHKYVGNKFGRKGGMEQGGAEMMYGSNMRPRQKMDLFYE